MLDPATHLNALDSFGIRISPDYAQLLERVRTTYNEYHTAQRRLDDLKKNLEKTANEHDFLIHNINELQALNVHVGEEDELATKRTSMMNAEKDAAILSDAIAALNPHGESLSHGIYNAANILLRIKTDPNPYAEQIDDLYSAAQIISDAEEKLVPIEPDVATLDSIEERLFAIRAAARKHRVSADELPEKLQQMLSELDAIENSDAELKKLTTDVSHKKSEFDKFAHELSNARTATAQQLRTQILAELPDLKLGSADFMASRTDATPSAHGIDDVVFMIKTNPGMPFAPLHRAASGGELARFMLALRVILTDGGPAHTFVFDEIDTGISGATASAVGSRLNRLATTSQTLVITHSAQVAGFADKHFKISKHTVNDTTVTDVFEIHNTDRVNEIARIISGAEITPESLATARTLIKNN